MTTNTSGTSTRLSSLIQAINPTGLFIKTALISMLLFGGLIGLSGLLSPFIHIPLPQPWILQHIHLQVWYFISGFVLAAGYKMLPQLTGIKLQNQWLPVISSLIFALGACLLIFYIPLAYSNASIRAGIVFLVVCEWFIWGGFILMGGLRIFQSTKKGVWSWVILAALAGFGVSTVLSGIGWLGTTDLLSADGHFRIRDGAKSALFVAIPLLVMGISGKVIRKKDYPDAPYLVGVLLVLTGMLGFIQIPDSEVLKLIGPYALLTGFGFLMWGMKLHRIKKALNIIAFKTGVIAAFLFMLLFTLLNLLQQFTDIMLINRSLTHIWAMGFLTSMIIAYATWVVPAAARKGPIHSVWLNRSVYILAFGTLIRALAPLFFELTGYQGMNGLLLAGGVLQYLAVLVFAIQLWSRIPDILIKTTDK